MYTIDDYIYGRVPRGTPLCCPFHGDRKPSAVVQPDTGAFYCYVCHTRGSQVEIAARIYFHDIRFPVNLSMAELLLRHDNVPVLAEQPARPAPDAAVLEVVQRWQKACAKALTPMQRMQLAEERAVFRPELLGIGYSTRDTFEMFYRGLPLVLQRDEVLIGAGLYRPAIDPDQPPARKFRLDDRWILPELRNGKPVHYTARAAGEAYAKYLHPPFPKVPYGWESLNRATSRIWLVEGPFDLYPLVEAGESVIAVNGAHSSQQLLDDLVASSRGRVVLVAFDNDPPDANGISTGQEAAHKTLAALRERDQVALHVIPRAKDIGEWIVRTSVGHVIAAVSWDLELA